MINFPWYSSHSQLKINYETHLIFKKKNFYSMVVIVEEKSSHSNNTYNKIQSTILVSNTSTWNGHILSMKVWTKLIITTHKQHLDKEIYSHKLSKKTSQPRQFAVFYKKIQKNWNLRQNITLAQILPSGYLLND